MCVFDVFEEFQQLDFLLSYLSPLFLNMFYLNFKVFVYIPKNFCYITYPLILLGIFVVSYKDSVFVKTYMLPFSFYCSGGFYFLWKASIFSYKYTLYFILMLFKLFWLLKQ